MSESTTTAEKTVLLPDVTVEIVAADEDIEQVPTVIETEESDIVASEATDIVVATSGTENVTGGANSYLITDGKVDGAVAGDNICIMEGLVQIDKVQYNLKLSNMDVTWIRCSGKSGPTSVPVQEIVSIKPYAGKNSPKDKTDGFTLCYVKHRKKCVLKRSSRHFVTEAEIANSWIQKIQDQINTLTQRPRKSLVLVNPVSGQRKGCKMCKKIVEPIFTEANIETEIIVTEKAHHTEEILANYDLSSIDSLVLIGGDGLYHEAVNGLQTRLMSEAGLDRDKPESEIQEILLPMGIVPCGTGNGIAESMYGCKDVETSVLAIVMGGRTVTNMFSLFSRGKLICYSSLLVGYGLFGDLIYAAENRRSSLGVFRYPVTMIEYILFRAGRRMNLTVDYLSPTPEVSPGNQVASSAGTPDVPSKANVNQEVATGNREPETKQQSTLPDTSNDHTNRDTVAADAGQESSVVTKQTSLQDTSAPDTMKEIPQDTCQETERLTLQASQDQSPCTNGNWKTIHGSFTLMLVFPVDMITMFYTHQSTDNGQTRFLLTKPQSRGTILKLFVSFITKDSSVMDSDKIIHDVVTECKVRVDNPNEPQSDFGIKEHLINVDGEPFSLPESAFHVKYAYTV